VTDVLPRQQSQYKGMAGILDMNLTSGLSRHNPQGQGCPWLQYYNRLYRYSPRYLSRILLCHIG